MDYPLRLRKDPNTFQRVTKDALKVIWAKAKKWKCRLIFEKGEKFYYGYKLKKFEQYVSPSGLFIRIHDSHFVRKDAILDCRYGYAILCNGKTIPVRRDLMDEVKRIVEENNNHPPLKAA